MLMVLGLPAACAKRSGTRLAPAAPIRTERRESMTTSEMRIADGARSAGTVLLGGGLLGPRQSARQRGRPRALAAFIQRPQAARSNRRLFRSLGEQLEGVN